MLDTKSDLKSAVLSQLSKGKANAITGKLLAQRLDEKGTRAIRLAIEELIREGHPICSSPQKPYGYFLAENIDEVNEVLKVLRYGYGMEILRHYKYLKLAGRKCFSGQLSLRL